MKLNATLPLSQLRNLLTLALFCSFFFFHANLLAQPLTGTKTVCSTGCNYASLTAAAGLFDAINTNGLGGNLTVTINGDLTEPGDIALNNITIGSTYTITIKPDAATLRTISGTTINATAPVGLIKLIGADNVTIDGNYLGSGKYLLFRNSNAVTSGGSTQPVFNIDNTSTSDVITNCIIESNATNGGRPPVLVNTTGTNNVTISNCDIRNATGGSTGNPNTAIRSTGTGNTLQILNNNIYNFTQYGIYLSGTAGGCTINGNSLYSTITSTSTGVTGIYITSNGGHTISGNYIGGNAPLCAGTWINSADVNFTGIQMSNSSPTASSIQGNTIQNISLTNNGGFNSSCILMDLGVGSYNVGTVTGNTLGHPTTANSITVATEGASGTIGIRCNGTSGTVNIANNIIANIKTTSTLFSTMTLKGIYNTGAITLDITGNDIHSLQNMNSTSESISAISLSGNGTNTITGNSISDLEASDATTATTLNGIILNTPTSTTISRNRIYDLRSLSPSGTINGVNMSGGIATLSHNQIAIINSNNTNVISIKGVVSGGTSTATLYYNSIYLGGSVSSGSINTYAYHRSGSGTSLLRNNILFNGRSGGTGRHYAIGNTNATPATGWGVNASNYNLLVSSDATYLGEWGASAPKDFATWKTSSAGDGNSWTGTSATISAFNMFANLNSNLNINTGAPEAWHVNGRAVQIPGQTADYGSAAAGRSVLVTTGAPDIGSDEMVPTFTPPAPTVTGTIGVGNTQTFTLDGRVLGTIQWTAGTSLPSAITLQHRPGTNPPNNLNNHYANAYWTISATGGTNYTYTLALYYDPATLGTAVENNLAISKKPEVSTAWAYLPTSVVNTTAKTVTVAGLTSFSHFTLTDNISPLPIKLESFTAKATTASVNLEWVVASENNVANYEIQRSENNVNFTTIAKVSAQGKNSTYSYADLNAMHGVNYYRLKMNENTGDFVYSNTVLGVLLAGLVHIAIYPNPVHDMLNVSVASSSSGKGNITIVDMTGRIVQSSTIHGTSMIINTKTWTNGIYFLKYDNQAQNEIIKFIKH